MALMSISTLSGFTIIKDGFRLSYSFKASLAALDHFCDEVIVNVGKCTDGTVEYIMDTYKDNDKFKIFIRDWEDKSQHTAFYSNQTNFALSKCTKPWGLYLQGDEVAHENDMAVLQHDLQRVESMPWVHGLVCRFMHFEGDAASVRGAYPLEVRVVKTGGSVESWGDAQSFQLSKPGMPKSFIWKVRTQTGDAVTPISHMRIFHYGYVRDPIKMTQKTMEMDGYYHNDEETQRMNAKTLENTDSGKWRYGHGNMGCYMGTHPKFVKEYVREYEHVNPQLIRVPAMFEDEL
jgi:hypothetical protein